VAQLIGLVPAAGGGQRFGSGMPKQYAPLAGAPLLSRTIERLQQSLPLEFVAVAIARDDAHYEHVIGPRKGVQALRCGGLTRAETVRNGLARLRDECADDDWVLVHDAARPCVPKAALLRLLASVWDDPVGGLLAIPLADTLKRADTHAGVAADAPRVLATEDRSALWRAQTPQMFRYAVLAKALAQEGALACTDESQAVEWLGLKPRLVPGSPSNLKITYPDDLAHAAAILALQAQQEESSR
jgi:2-C-methyl-D-erythritol 4-phosphate cytidylyltransferase